MASSRKAKGAVGLFFQVQFPKRMSRRRRSRWLALLASVRGNKKPHPAWMGFGMGSMSGRRELNPQHSAWKADTLPIELRPQSFRCQIY